ncbi:hypothetical protein AB833_07765 [Chromatiales bacterium (ex Bugula neritina AB1)]|nr:hypothetical protein AB833_07765 [Chromatiales bacterium (ex Bugula neritina AB1)]
MTRKAITDLSIDKSVDDDTPKLGQEITWTIDTFNESDTFAENVVVTDLIPDGLEFISADASDGAFNQSTGIWSIGGLDSGEHASLSISTIVTDANHHITNTAEISSDTHDCNSSNDVDSLTIIPWEPTRADLSIEKTVSDAEPEIGSTVDWTVRISNSGPDASWNTVVTDTLPSGVTFLDATPDVGNYDPESGEWDIGKLNDGEGVELVITTRIDDEGAATYVNTAVATSSTTDHHTENNTAHASITVTDDPIDPPSPPPVSCCCACDRKNDDGADLQVVKLVSNPQPNLNSEVTWSILVTNNGPEDASNVVVTDNLPAGLEYVSNTLTAGEFIPDAGQWEIGDLASGASTLLQIKTVVTDAEHAQHNIAVVSSDTEDSDPSNNVSQASLDAINADLELNKSVDNAEPDLGETVTWSIDITNKGPDPAHDVVVTDALPAGVTFTGASNSDFNPDTGSLALGTLEAGARVSFTIDVTVDDADGARVNNASVFSSTYDDDLSNNSDDASTDAVAADLAIVKSVDNPSPDLNTEVTWTISVVNNGPDTALDVVINDSLPEGVTFVESSVEAFNPENGTLSIGDLASGEEFEFSITVTVDNADRALVNNATVSSPTYDNDPDNNSDAAETDAVAADLELTKETSTDEAEIGDTVNWTLSLTNQGPDAATNIVIEDLLPDGVSYVSDSSTPDSPESVFDSETGLWSIESLEVGEAVTLTLETTVTDSGVIINTAQVTASDQVDPDSKVNNDDGDQSEDDEDSSQLTVPEQNRDPIAADDEFALSLSSEQTVNAVIMIDHSGSMGSITGPDQSGSPFAVDLQRPNGEVTSRLQLVREAVVDFASKEQVAGVKILGFDTVSEDISDWFDVSGENPDTTELQNYVDDLQASGFTNYVAALEATQDNADISGAPTAIPANYYFLTDGDPLLPSGPEDATPNAREEADWQAFVDNNFNDAYGIGFGSGITNTTNLDIISHPDDSTNTIVTSDADGIPADLIRTVTESLKGNVLSNDTANNPGPLTVSALTIDGNVLSYDGTDITSSQELPLTSLTEGANASVPTASGGRLEFNFETGEFEYLSPATEISLTETFNYTVTDSEGLSDSAALTIDVEPFIESPIEPAVLLTDPVELFTTDSLVEQSVTLDRSGELEPILTDEPLPINILLEFTEVTI